MATFQNTGLVKKPSLILGSLKLEVAERFGGPYTNVGLGRGFTLTEEVTELAVQVDNGPDPISGISRQEIVLAGELVEQHLPTLHMIRGGLDTLTSVDGTAVTGATMTLAPGNWDVSTFIPLLHQSVDENDTTVTSIAGSAAGTLTEDTDYVVMDDGTGVVGVIMIGTNVDVDDDTLTITYGYTPATSRKLSSGGRGSIEGRAWKLTNINEDGDSRIWHIYNGFFVPGGAQTFQSDNADDPISIYPITVRGKVDSTRTAGDQLWSWEDEASTA